MIASAYVLELALGENSVGRMAAFFVFLYLAMLTHFSAILFAGAVGGDSLWRLCSGEPSRTVVATWVAGQAGALGLFVFLFRTHIASLKNSPDAQHMQVALGNSYFHPGQSHLLPFVLQERSESFSTRSDSSRSVTLQACSLFLPSRCC